MQTKRSQKIIKRFFEAIYTLKKARIISGKITFTKRYGINSRNFWQLEQDKSRDIFQVEWLTNLVNDYGVSAEWLITGKGKMFKKNRNKVKKRYICSTKIPYLLQYGNLFLHFPQKVCIFATKLIKHGYSKIQSSKRKNNYPD
jgi:hypothetical protein